MVRVDCLREELRKTRRGGGASHGDSGESAPVG